MSKNKCLECNGTGCRECPVCKGEGSNDHKTCKKCKRSPFNVNPCGDGAIKCSACNGTGIEK